MVKEEGEQKGERPLPWRENGRLHSHWPHRVNANVPSSDGSGITALHLEKKHNFDTPDNQSIRIMQQSPHAGAHVPGVRGNVAAQVLSSRC